MDQNKKKDGQNEFEEEFDQALETEPGENALETEPDGNSEETETAPEYDLEADEDWLQGVQDDPEFVHVQQAYRMGPASGRALAHGEELIHEMKELAERITEEFPGYADMDWLSVLADVSGVYPVKTMLRTELPVYTMTVGVWHLEEGDAMFREGYPADPEQGKTAAILTAHVENGAFCVRYYCRGDFRERPVLMMKKKGDSEEETFSVMMDSMGRSEYAGCMMEYEGWERDLEDGIYEIEFLTNMRKNKS